MHTLHTDSLHAYLLYIETVWRAAVCYVSIELGKKGQRGRLQVTPLGLGYTTFKKFICIRNNPWFADW